MKASELTCRIVSHFAPDLGLVLEAVFQGPHREGAAGEMQNFLKGAIATHEPAVLIINLTGFRYTFGDDVGGALVAACGALGRLDGRRQCRIVAVGNTARSLERLLDMARMLPFFGGRLFPDLDSALSDAGSPSGE